MPLTCTKCVDKPCIKTGKVCKDIERLLNKIQAKEGYSDRHRRRKERIFPIEVVERIGAERAFKIKFGGRKEPSYDSEQNN